VDGFSSSVEANKSFSFTLHATSNKAPIYDTTYTVDLYDGDSFIKQENVNFKDGIGTLSHTESSTGNHNYKIKIEHKNSYKHEKNYYNYDYSYLESNKVSVPVEVYAWKTVNNPVSLSVDPSGGVHVDDNLLLTVSARSNDRSIVDGNYNMSLYRDNMFVKSESVPFKAGTGRLNYTEGEAGNHSYKIVLQSKEYNTDDNAHTRYIYDNSDVVVGVPVNKYDVNLALSKDNNDTVYGVGLCLNLTRSDGLPVDDGEYLFMITETLPNNMMMGMPVSGHVSGGVMRFNYDLNSLFSSLNVGFNESRKYKGVNSSITPNLQENILLSSGEENIFHKTILTFPKWVVSKILGI